MKDRRLYFRKGLNKLYLPYYDALCDTLKDQRWQPYSSVRTAIEQRSLYEQGRSKPGHVVTNAKEWQSPHNYGCASDWCLWDDHGRPDWPDAGSTLWSNYSEAVTKVGLTWGGEFDDSPHNELKISYTWKHLATVHKYEGAAVAFAKLELAIVG